MYDFKNRIWVFLEYMEEGSLTDMILCGEYKHYSEDFARYTIYNVARGILAMHKKNVLHRDIKSDNILCRANGDIKIADLGFSVFLSQ